MVRIAGAEKLEGAIVVEIYKGAIHSKCAKQASALLHRPDRNQPGAVPFEEPIAAVSLKIAE
jgi:hypothetical protein